MKDRFRTSPLTYNIVVEKKDRQPNGNKQSRRNKQSKESPNINKEIRKKMQTFQTYQKPETTNKQPNYSKEIQPIRKKRRCYINSKKCFLKGLCLSSDILFLILQYFIDILNIYEGLSYRIIKDRLENYACQTGLHNSTFLNFCRNE